MPGNAYLSHVRYARDMTLHITLQSESSAGRIYPPYLEITYADVSSADREAGATVRCSFQVVYSMDGENFRLGVAIAMAVTSLWALVVAFIDTSTWNRRSGKVRIKLPKVYLHVCTVRVQCSTLTNFYTLQESCFRHFRVFFILDWFRFRISD